MGCGCAKNSLTSTGFILINCAKDRVGSSGEGHQNDGDEGLHDLAVHDCVRSISEHSVNVQERTDVLVGRFEGDAISVANRLLPLKVNAR